MANGWTGNILRVNLTTGNITLEDSSKFKSFVGGMGFGYKIMYDEVPPGTKPFDEANKLVFATGPLTGSGAPCSSRVNITSLSTFTCNFAFFSGLISAQFWAGRAQPKSPELGANLLVMFPVFHSQQQTTGERIIAA